MKNYKEMPKRVIETKIDYLCPSCKHNLWELINRKGDRCDECGQRLDWGNKTMTCDLCESKITREEYQHNNGLCNDCFDKNH